MASRSAAAAETDALRGGVAVAMREDQAQGARSKRGMRMGVAAAVGMLVCAGVAIASWSVRGVRLSTVTNLAASETQLRGATSAEPETQASKHQRVADGPPRAWDVLSDPQPAGPDDEKIAPSGPEHLKAMLLEQFGLSQPAASEGVQPPTMRQASPPETPTGDGDDSNKQQLKEMLLKEFGMTGPQGQQKQSADPSESLLTSSDPEAQALRKQLKHELRDQLMAALMPHGSPSSDASASQNDWNWLQPAAESYSQVVGDRKTDTIDVSDVLHDLHEQRAARTHALVGESYRVDSQYARTVECFVRGVKQVHTFTLSRGEYEGVIGWMNDKCATAEGPGVGDAHKSTASSKTTNAALEKAMNDHFDRLVGDFKAGNLDAQRALAQAQAIRAKIAACIARATENAADASGRVDESELGGSLDWIVTQCASLPSP